MAQETEKTNKITVTLDFTDTEYQQIISMAEESCTPPKEILQVAMNYFFNALNCESVLIPVDMLIDCYKTYSENGITPEQLLAQYKFEAKDILG